MTARPDSLPWRFLWQYVSLWDDDEPPPQGLGGELDPNDEKQNTQDASGDASEDIDGGEIGDELPFEEDDEGDEIPIGETDDDEDAYEISEPDEVPPQIPGFEILRHENGTIDYLREFTSWFDFATSASDASARQWRESNCASQQVGNERWNGTETFNEAVEMALRRGWPEGRELLRDSIVAVRPRPKVYESLEFEVAGAFPCVPVYCAGDPAWMISDPGASVRSAKPIVRIDYNHWVHAGVDIKSMMLRGAAIVSLADSLERQGFSTELRIVGNSRPFYSPKVFRYSITYKEAGETLDLDRAAFAIAHPASMRRLAFAILEQHKDLESAFKSNYGVPLYEANISAQARASLDSMTLIFVPGSRGNETPASAQAAVEKAAQTLLNQLKEAA